MGMISPLCKGHRGGALSISSSSALYSSWGRGSSAAAEASATGTLGWAPAAAIGEAPAAGELWPAAELGPTASMAPGVEVSVGEVGPWHTRDRKE